MHVSRLYTSGNIVKKEDIISYYYKITPINSLFSSTSQQSTLYDTMKDLLVRVNMPGQIIIRPRKIESNKVYTAYANNFNKYGKKGFEKLAKDYLVSLKEILSQSIKYRYEIYLVFCDGRDELRKKQNIKLFGSDNKSFTKTELKIFQTIESEIFKKLQGTVKVEKLKENKIEELHNYLAIPVEEKLEEYYVEELPLDIKYTYRGINKNKTEQICSRTMVASKFENLSVEKGRVNDILNTLQLERFPIDTIVKFDLEHTRQFARDMQSKKEEINKAHKRYIRLGDKKDRLAEKAEVLAKIGMESDESVETTKVKFQMFFRTRAADVDSVELRSEILKRKLAGAKINLSSEAGQQIDLANTLFPYSSKFKRYVQVTDMAYFVQYNFLGGIYIGDEEEGMIEAYTKPGEIPIFYDVSKPLLGKTKTASSVTIYCGETGSGKTQLADHRAFQNMIFKGMRTLTIDPKGDREKKIQLLGDKASQLKIGAKDNKNGMFDAYLIADDFTEGLNQAIRDIDAMVKALGLNRSVDYKAIQDAHNSMLEDLKANQIKKATFKYLVEEKLKEYDLELSNQIMILEKDTLARLFFAPQDYSNDISFNLNKYYNLITFEKSYIAPDDPNNDPNRLDNALFAIVLSRVQSVVAGFMRKFGTEENMLVIDEFKVFKETPGGAKVVDDCARQCRSWQTHLSIITQSLSDVPSSILNNTGQLFIGGLKSSQEIEYVLKELKLEDHAVVKDVLTDKTSDEGLDSSKKYSFLMQDYNNRKSIVKLNIPRVFNDTFKTLKEEVSNVANQKEEIKNTVVEEMIYET